MKFTVPENKVSFSPLLTPANKGSDPERVIYKKEQAPGFVAGFMKSGQREIPVVSSELRFSDKWGTLRARLGSFRMSYSVAPGLYALGDPDENSTVFVTANYKMSFDSLRSSLHGMNGWILVLDTNGINVWCAAGKGTFGTEELVRRIKLSGLAEIVTHRKLVVPQLGGPGIDSAEVRRRSGFRVKYGPVRSRDLKKYLENDFHSDREMRRVNFDMLDRLILTPIEIRQILPKFLYFILSVFVVFGLNSSGIIFRDSITKGYLFFISGILSVFTGAFLTPLLLPFIPFRAFSVKGWLSGAAILVAFFYFTGAFYTHDLFLLISALILFPVVSSYLALQFTGASTYTSLSGVKREIKIAFPLYISGMVVSLVFIVIYKCKEWGIL